MLNIAGLLAQSAVSQMARLDVISNNVANANTIGFKKDEMLFSDFSSVLQRVIENGAAEVKRISYGVKPSGVIPLIQQGELRKTENRLDFAITGKGFFSVQTPKGELYTRNGSFSVDKEGFLITSEGNKVLGFNGAIKIEGESVVVNNLGEIIVDGEYVDRFLIKDFPKPYRMKKEGANYFSSDVSGFVSGNYQVKQGFLEDSTVNPVKEMVNMIEAHRSYEASANAIRIVDTLLGTVINEVSRL